MPHCVSYDQATPPPATRNHIQLNKPAGLLPVEQRFGSQAPLPVLRSPQRATIQPYGPLASPPFTHSCTFKLIRRAVSPLRKTRSEFQIPNWFTSPTLVYISSLLAAERRQAISPLRRCSSRNTNQVFSQCKDNKVRY